MPSRDRVTWNVLVSSLCTLSLSPSPEQIVIWCTDNRLLMLLQLPLLIKTRFLLLHLFSFYQIIMCLFVSLWPSTLRSSHQPVDRKREKEKIHLSMLSSRNVLFHCQVKADITQMLLTHLTFFLLLLLSFFFLTTLIYAFMRKHTLSALVNTRCK